MKQLLFFVICIGLSFSALADSELKQAFNLAYTNYQAAERDGAQFKVYQYAKESYQLGSRLYGEDHINTANLAINWAIALTKARKRTEALAVIKTAISILEDKFDDPSMELVIAYETLGDAIDNNNKKKAKAYSRALYQLEDLEEVEPLVIADIQTRLGNKLLSAGSMKSRVLVDANEVFAKHLKPDTELLIYSNFYVGKYYLARGKNSKAIKYFSKNLPVFEKIGGSTHHLELISRAFLVQAHEERGDSDEATEHCIAIGSMKPWDENQEQTPLFRVSPTYPSSAARFGKEGWVRVAFNVTPTGFVNNLTVLDSKGGDDFQEQALKAVEQWRYAPKFKDGKAVDAQSSVHINFALEKK